LETATLAEFSLGEPSVAELYDRYLDTADGSARAWGYACRLRRKNDEYIATLKGLGWAADAIHRRVEHEVVLTGPISPQDWPASTARDLALRLCGNEPLTILFDIKQTRHSRPLYDRDRAVAEISLDRVRIYRGGSMIATCLELEAELSPDGREQDLERLVTELKERWGLAPERRSKYERGLALLGMEAAREQDSESEAKGRLSPRERDLLERLTEKPEVIARRARLLLAWDDELSREEMIQQSGLSPRRVRHWLSVFPEQRLGIFPDRVLSELAEVEDVPPPARFEIVPAATATEDLSAEIESNEPEKSPPSTAQITLPDKPGIKPDDPMSEAGRKTFRFQYLRMIHHEPGTRLGEDIEALHDMRVATRRMRAAFRVFGDYFDPKVISPHLKGLKRTGRALGAVRDLDVFRVKIQDYLNTLPTSQQSSLDGLLNALEEQREIARERMIAYLDSRKYSRFVERFGEFVESEGMGSLPVALNGGEPRPYRVRHVAPMAIHERLAHVRAYDEWVSIPDPPLARLHALRIACKRLRYTLEFFRETLGPDAKTLIDEIVVMQDHLGDLQDAVVASGILRDYLVWGTWGHDAAKPPPDWAAPVVAPGVAAYLAAKQSELQHLLDTFPEAWQRLKGIEFSQMVAETVAVL
jgi:CHAD domain-containing protein